MHTTCITVAAKKSRRRNKILKINFTNNKTSEEKKYIYACIEMSIVD